MKAAHRRTNKRVRLVAAFVCCLLAAHPAALTGAGRQRDDDEPRIDLDLFGGESKAAILSRIGPQMIAAYALGNLSIAAFARDEQPVVVEYQLGLDSTATLTIRQRDKKDKSVIFTLNPTGKEIKQMIFPLPKGIFGSKPVIADFNVEAKLKEQAGHAAGFGLELARSSAEHPLRRVMNARYVAGEEGQQAAKEPDFELYGIGMGDKAVGSMGIDRLNFEPAHVHATKKERVTYSFYSRFDFEKAYAEFHKKVVTQTGARGNKRIYDKEIDATIRRGESVSGEWNGKDKKGKVSNGFHQLVVKAWYGEKKGGDWTRAWSRRRVYVD